MIAAVERFNTALKDANAFVHAGGLHPPSTAVTVDSTGSEATRTPGPFVDATAYVGGFWIIDVSDQASALAWGNNARRQYIRASKSAHSKKACVRTPDGGAAAASRGSCVGPT